MLSRRSFAKLGLAVLALTKLPSVALVYSQPVKPLQAWVVPMGQLLFRADYPELYAAIGTAYGNTTDKDFKLPNHAIANPESYQWYLKTKPDDTNFAIGSIMRLAAHG